MLPQLENAVLAGHDVIFLGERGQAKTRMIRSLVELLDEWMPIVAGSEINDDPYAPVSRHARDLVAAEGDDTPIDWVHRDRRYGEKLATPDTSIADLIGEVDPIKVAEGRYLSDELDHPLRPGAPHQPRHLRHQRAARPGRAHPGRPAQRARGARRPDPRLQGAAAARRGARRVGQPRGLHQPGPHHHPAQGPLRQPDPHPLPARRRDRGGDRPAGVAPVRRRRRPGQRAAVHDRDRRHAQPSRPRQRATSTSARACRCGSRCPTTRCWWPTPSAGRCTTASATSAPRVSDLDALAASTMGKVEIEALDDGRDEQIAEHLVRAATLSVFKSTVDPGGLRDIVVAFDEGRVVHTGEDVTSTDLARLVEDVPALPRAGRGARRGRREPCRRGQRGRARPRGPAPVEAPQQGRRRRAGHVPLALVALRPRIDRPTPDTPDTDRRGASPPASNQPPALTADVSGRWRSGCRPAVGA